MLNETRVLSRQKAREITQEEVQLVSGTGTLRTLTACTFGFQGAIDGDAGEC